MLNSESDPMSKQSADSYVQTVMASNIVSVPVEIHAERPVSNFNTFALTPRKTTKRRRSDGNNKNGTKKQRNSPGVLDDKNRHALEDNQCIGVQGKASNKSDMNTIKVVSKQTNSNDLNDLKIMVGNLTDSMNTLRDHLSTRIDSLESNFAKTIEKVVDRKIETAMKKERNIVHKEMKNLESKVAKDIEQLKVDVNEDFQSVKNEISSLKDRCQEPMIRPEAEAENNKRNNAIIRNLAESENENLFNKVSGLLKDGLRLKNISIHSVERKRSFREGKPGLVIVKFQNAQDKREVMEVKKTLREARNYRDVFIENDLPKAERMLNANLRHIVNTIGKDKLEIRGSRIQTKRNDNESRERTDLSRQLYEQRGRRHEQNTSNNVRDSYRRENEPRDTDNFRQSTHRGGYRNGRHY
ncbi:uncharacterized protein PF3D7_1120000-like [Mytilus edulis]|uniref:uncharacterized protein PF3D7_1120000-like n=1 Tax=Mytilus edulis TaxID=6550 RepID=UPI0039EF4CF0